jgi:hypothetical protein
MSTASCSSSTMGRRSTASSPRCSFPSIVRFGFPRPRVGRQLFVRPKKFCDRQFPGGKEWRIQGGVMMPHLRHVAIDVAPPQKKKQVIGRRVIASLDHLLREVADREGGARRPRSSRRLDGHIRRSVLGECRAVPSGPSRGISCSLPRENPGGVVPSTCQPRHSKATKDDAMRMAREIEGIIWVRWGLPT